MLKSLFALYREITLEPRETLRSNTRLGVNRFVRVAYRPEREFDTNARV
jgi:hypothetical protein